MHAWNRLAIAALTVALPIAPAQAVPQSAGDSRSAHSAGTGSTQGMLSLQLWHATTRDAIVRDKPNQVAEVLP